MKFITYHSFIQFLAQSTPLHYRLSMMFDWVGPSGLSEISTLHIIQNARPFPLKCPVRSQNYSLHDIISLSFFFSPLHFSVNHSFSEVDEVQENSGLQVVQRQKQVIISKREKKGLEMFHKSGEIWEICAPWRKAWEGNQKRESPGNNCEGWRVWLHVTQRNDIIPSEQYNEMEDKFLAILLQKNEISSFYDFYLRLI